MPQVQHRSYRSPILAQGPAYLDSSVVVGFITTADRFHSQAVQFVGDHAVAGVQMQVSLLTIDETIWTMARGMVARALNKPVRSIALGSLLKRGPGVLAPHLPAMRQAIHYVTTWAVLTQPSAPPDVVLDSWWDRLSDIGGVHDAKHLALAEHAGARSFITADNDYRQVKRLPFPLNIYKL